MHDLGRVHGEGLAALGVLVCDQLKHAMHSAKAASRVSISA